MLFLIGTFLWLVVVFIESDLESFVPENARDLEDSKTEPKISNPQQKTKLNSLLIEPEIAVEKEEINRRFQNKGPKNYNGGQIDEGLTIYNLSKKYNNQFVVNNVSLSLKKGECFGILGIAGSGRTTLIRMLATEIIPTHGSVFIGNYEMRKHLKQYRIQIGYAPQHPIIYKDFTGTELLSLHGNMRILQGSVDEEIDFILKALDFVNEANKKTSEMSLLVQRKLAIGIAFIGSPLVVLLDEPMNECSTDDERNLLISAINTLVRGSCVVISFSRFDCCQALCNRLTIMTFGELRCLGSVPYLTNKYQNGYLIILNTRMLSRAEEKENEVKNEDDDQEAATAVTEAQITRELSIFFPNSVALKNQRMNMLQYHIFRNTFTREYVFKSLESLKDNYFIEDYIITDASLYFFYFCCALIQSIEDK